MTHHSQQILNASLQAVPVAMIFTKQLLLTQKTSVTVKSDAAGAQVGSQTVRATKLTSVLRNIQGYSHDGLNE